MSYSEYAIEGLLFDLDGTLMDTASDFITAVHQMQTDDQRSCWMKTPYATMYLPVHTDLCSSLINWIRTILI